MERWEAHDSQHATELTPAALVPAWAEEESSSAHSVPPGHPSACSTQVARPVHGESANSGLGHGRLPSCWGSSGSGSNDFRSDLCPIGKATVDTTPLHVLEEVLCPQLCIELQACLLSALNDPSLLGALLCSEHPCVGVPGFHTVATSSGSGGDESSRCVGSSSSSGQQNTTASSIDPGSSSSSMVTLMLREVVEVKNVCPFGVREVGHPYLVIWIKLYG